MPSNLFDQATKTDRTYSDGMSWTWHGDSCTFAASTGASSARTQTCFTGDITNTPFEAGKSYVIEYTASVVQLYVYYYTDAALTTLISSFYTLTDTTTTIPSNCGGILIRLRVPANTVPNETVTPIIYLGTSDVDADIAIMDELINNGPYYNSWFYDQWIQFTSLPWDGESCSEIACSISYMGGNVSKIYVSNYAAGMAALYQANGRFINAGAVPQPGDFVWWDYDGDGTADHSGRVWHVNGDMFETVEGNVYSYVTSFTYSRFDSTIYGYGRPNYTGQIIPGPGGLTPTFVYAPFWRHMRRIRGNY